MSSGLKQFYADCYAAIYRKSDKDLSDLLNRSDDLVKQLVSREPYDLLNYAIRSGSTSQLEILLNHGFDLHKIVDGWEALWMSIHSGDEMNIFLINHGAKLYTKGTKSVLDIMVDCEYTLNLELLTKHFFVISNNHPASDRKILKKFHIENNIKFMTLCRLSLLCKDCISRKLFF